MYARRCSWSLNAARTVVSARAYINRNTDCLWHLRPIQRLPPAYTRLKRLSSYRPYNLDPTTGVCLRYTTL